MDEYKGLTRRDVKKLIKDLFFYKNCFVSVATYNKYKTEFNKFEHKTKEFENGYIITLGK